MRRFFVDKRSIRSGRATIRGSDMRHIQVVLRLKPGDEILLFDGEGSEYVARITENEREKIALLILEKYSASSESRLQLSMGQALLKARKMDHTVRHLTELGAFAFLPFVAERSVPKPRADRLSERQQRWEVITRESVKQCGRSRALYIAPVVSLQDLISSHQSYDLRILFHSSSSGIGLESILKAPRNVRRVLALVGPEGGFTDEEVTLAVGSGFCSISLGPRILKADTAAIVAGAILQYALGDLGGLQKSLDKD
jgi:16S rRNA (uracil1498-N3)-methyltransferase